VHKYGSGRFREYPSLWRLSSESQQAKNMIKVPEHGREGVCLKVGVKALGFFFLVVAFQRLSKEEGKHKVEQACTNLVLVDFLIIQGFGDLVQGLSKPNI